MSKEIEVYSHLRHCNVSSSSVFLDVGLQPEHDDAHVRVLIGEAGLRKLMKEIAANVPHLFFQAQQDILIERIADEVESRLK